MTQSSTVLADYLPAFARPDEPFLAYYRFGPDKLPRRELITRGEFWSLARKSAGVLARYGIGRGDCFALYFSGNRYIDLAFRLGATMIGAVPVTVNWQADTLERVEFKIELTAAELVVIDNGVSDEVITTLSAKRPGLKFFSIEHLESQAELDEGAFCRDEDFDSDATRIVIFTSGTTARPKGVRLPYRSYRANRSTFESFLRISDGDDFALLVVNPMHHTNSTAMADWAMRRAGTTLHLIERYSTQYWSLLVDIDGGGHDRVVVPLVSKHFDFLDSLHQTDRLPVGADALRQAMGRMDFLLGSAPVGPTTIERLKKYTGRLPLVRFGSTETCLQVVGTPPEMSDHDRMSAFQKGWSHTWDGDRMSGYYIGRSHPPYTESKIVRSITPSEPDYFVDCREGEPGYLVTRGDNLMTEYVADDEATRKVIHEDGWYTGLGDICFWRTNESDGHRDHYWMSRDSAMLIRGGANYSFDQINAELKAFVADRYALGDDDFDLAVVGLKVRSEHEDDCCVTMELKSPSAVARRAEMEAAFLSDAGEVVSKGAKPDWLGFAKVPRNFKGAVLVPQLKKDCESAICSDGELSRQAQKT